MHRGKSGSNGELRVESGAEAFAREWAQPPSSDFPWVSEDSKNKADMDLPLANPKDWGEHGGNGNSKQASALKEAFRSAYHAFQQTGVKTPNRFPSYTFLWYLSGPVPEGKSPLCLCGCFLGGVFLTR